jgi:hypothetical protein
LPFSAGLCAADQTVSNQPTATVAQLVSAVLAKAKALENSSGTKAGYASFHSSFGIQPGSVPLSDYAVAHLLYEATRDAGFWNLHWAITDQPPNSDNIWGQWKTVRQPSPATPTATAECDELSALYAFLGGRAGIRGIGLFWPAANHTIAVWMVRQPAGIVRVAIPTTQIFLDQNDYWGTRKFDPGDPLLARSGVSQGVDSRGCRARSYASAR